MIISFFTTFFKNQAFLKFLGNVLSTIGILTIIQFILYINIGQDYENITVKKVSLENLNSDTYSQYDIIGEINLDEDNKFPNHIKLLIGPENKIMSNISFYYSNGVSNYGTVDYQLLKTTKYDYFRKLNPQQYLLITAPITEGVPAAKMNFDLEYKKGSYIFSSNLRSGNDDRVTLPVKRTILSFLSK